MKVFISFDMEGVAGIVDWSQCRGPGQPYEEGRLLLRTVSISGEDPLAMFRSFVGVTYITRVSEGR